MSASNSLYIVYNNYNYNLQDYKEINNYEEESRLINPNLSVWDSFVMFS